MTSAEVRLSGVYERRESIRTRFPNIVIEHGDLVLYSALDTSEPLNAHLVWLWGRLNLERRFLKNIRQCGGKLVCRCKVPRGGVRLLPNAAEMLHLLEMELVLEVR